MALDIMNKLNVEGHGLLSKIQIGGKTYEIKDLIARQNIEALAGLIDAINYIKNTGVYADDAAIKAAIEASAKATKDELSAQIGAINKFDIAVVDELPEASADTMYILYLVKRAGSTGEYVEYITVRHGEEGAYTYSMEQIGSTAMDLTGFVTEEALEDALEPINTRLGQLGDLANKNEAELDLKALAHKDNASGTVASETITGIKANGQSAGSITVELEQSEHAMNSTGKYTPAGNVAGSVTVASHQVPVEVSHTATDAALTKGDYTPAGNVSVALSGASFNAITGVGTQASFKEGAFTPATLEYAAADYSVAKEGIVGSVDDNECLVFTAAGVEAISASKINAFNGGSKAADEFTANSLPTMAAHEVGVQSSTFTGTKAEKLVITGVSYDKATAGTGTCAGGTYDINASFTGTEGDVAVAGLCHDYAVKTAQFNPAAIELSVGDITVSEKTVTVQ